MIGRKNPQILHESIGTCRHIRPGNVPRAISDMLHISGLVGVAYSGCVGCGRLLRLAIVEKPARRYLTGGGR